MNPKTCVVMIIILRIVVASADGGRRGGEWVSGSSYNVLLLRKKSEANVAKH